MSGIDTTPAAVLDSNAAIDLYSIHNLSDPALKFARRPARFQRARDALLMAICLHEMKATTYSIHEVINRTRALVPPDTGTKETQFTTAVVYFVADEVLASWDAQVELDAQPHGNSADGFLTDKALEWSVPLITSDAKMSKRARVRGIEVCTPAEYWRDRIDSKPAARRFLGRYRAKQGTFARTMEHAANWARLLDMVYGFYRFLLLGRGP